MRFGIFAVILILGSIPMTVLEHSMHAYYRSAMINNTQAQLRYRLLHWPERLASIRIRHLHQPVLMRLS